MKKQAKLKTCVECSICHGYECVNARKQYETCADCPVMVFGLNPKNKIDTSES